MNPTREARDPLRVIVVDDSPVTRRIVERVLSRSTSLEVVGLLCDGTSVAELVVSERIDVIVLDLEMPEHDGLSVLQDLARVAPDVATVIYSGAEPSIVRQVRSRVHSGILTKFISKAEGAASGIADLNAKLVPLVLEIGAEGRRRRTREGAHESRCSSPVAPLPSKPEASGLRGVPELMVIGASTGGPDALRIVLGSLAADLPVPVAVVQHMPVGFTNQLAARLDSHCKVAVREAVDGERLEPGVVLIAPGGQHLEVHRNGTYLVARLTMGEPRNSCRPAVDVLFGTAALASPGQTLALVLTGMGRDGLEGVGAIRAGGGIVLVQDEPSSVVWGMPGAIANAGTADEVLPLDQLGPRASTLLTRSSGVRGRAV